MWETESNRAETFVGSPRKDARDRSVASKCTTPAVDGSSPGRGLHRVASPRAASFRIWPRNDIFLSAVVPTALSYWGAAQAVLWIFAMEEAGRDCAARRNGARRTSRHKDASCCCSCGVRCTTFVGLQFQMDWVGSVIALS